MDNQGNYNSNLNFEKFVQEAYEYFNTLAEELGHPNEQSRAAMIWRAVVHTIRDRIHMSEFLDMISPLPMLLKAMAIEGWKYRDKPLYDYTTIEQMKTLVKAHQNQYGEYEFDWSNPTDEIITTVIRSLERYIPESQLEQIRGQLPAEVKEVIPGE